MVIILFFNFTIISNLVLPVHVVIRGNILHSTLMVYNDDNSIYCNVYEFLFQISKVLIMFICKYLLHNAIEFSGQRKLCASVTVYALHDYIMHIVCTYAPRKQHVQKIQISTQLLHNIHTKWNAFSILTSCSRQLL